MTEEREPNEPQAALDALRQSIDEIDGRILELLNARARVALEIGKVKKASHKPFYVPQRERALLDRLQRENAGPFPNQAIPLVFREIISASLALENPLTVAFLGPDSTFTHLAAKRRFGGSARLVPCATIADIFDRVARAQASFGVVPVENSSEGVVTHTLDQFVSSSLKICAEVSIEVHLYLMSQEPDLTRLTKVYSHPQALAQCRKFIESELAHVTVVEVESTARAAQLVQKEPEAAAIASVLASELYGLPILRARIEDQVDNFTRFLVISEATPAPTGNDKTSILFTLGDGPGSLFHVLRPFADLKVNLTKIESRPSKKKLWDYIFFIDLDGHIDEPDVQRAVELLAAQCTMVKHLGSYPKEETLKP